MSMANSPEAGVTRARSAAPTATPERKIARQRVQNALRCQWKDPMQSGGNRPGSDFSPTFSAILGRRSYSCTAATFAANPAALKYTDGGVGGFLISRGLNPNVQWADGFAPPQ